MYESALLRTTLIQKASKALALWIRVTRCQYVLEFKTTVVIGQFVNKYILLLPMKTFYVINNVIDDYPSTLNWQLFPL